MNDELKDISERLKGISNELGKMRQEHKRDKLENLGLIAIGLSVATVGLTVANPNPYTIGVTGGLLILGCVAVGLSGRVKAK